MTDTNQKLRIDMVSDVMCPWCLIGYLQLQKALQQTNTSYEIHWHPFELNPDMPDDGQNVREHLTQKYGLTVEQSKNNRATITKTAKSLGFEVNFSDDLRMYNTFCAHQLLRWAEQQSKQHALKMALFTAHFTHNRDVSDYEVLANIANSVGLDKQQALRVLKEQCFADEVRQEETYFTQQGIQGVPAIIFNNRHLVTGAQGVDNFVAVIEQLTKGED